MEIIEIFGGNLDKYIYAVFIFIFIQLIRLVFKKIITKVIQKTNNIYDDEIVSVIKKPIKYLFIFLGIKLSVTVLILSTDIAILINHITSSGFIFILFWSFIKLLNYFTKHLSAVTNRFGDKISTDVANFIVKSIRIFIFAIGLFTILQEWGYNISGFLASLGLVGMAFALAAKDTAANLFGSLVIFTDKPFKVDDWIKTPDVEGTIESIGIRSTRVRTFSQAQVTVPNATLANSAILNWSKMGKRRIKMNIGLTYDTKVSQLEKVILDIKNMLSKHPDIHQSTIHIYFTTFDDSSLSIFCYFFTKTTNWGEFMRVRENTNFKIMKIVEQNNTSFAFPSRSVYIENNNEGLI
jgi:MscS family membrane protein